MVLLFAHSGGKMIICSDNMRDADISFDYSHIFKFEANLYSRLLWYMSLKKIAVECFDFFQRNCLKRFLEMLKPSMFLSFSIIA